MSESLPQVGDLTVLTCPADGDQLRDESDVLDVIGDALGRGADLVVIPAARLPETFFQLRTGIAGAILQKFVNYRLRLAIVGDISAHTDASTALRDLVIESNRGAQHWFLADQAELEQRLVRR